MSDSIPSASAHAPDSSSTRQTGTAASTSAEDRKAAAALSSLNTTEITTDSESRTGTGKPASSADQEALGKAMSRLEIAAGQKHSSTPGTSQKKNGGGVGGKKKAQAQVQAVVKVSGEDVTLLVNELNLSKVKATELLKANKGDARKAIRAFISPGPISS